MNEGTNQHNGTERNGTKNGTTRNMEHRIVGNHHYTYTGLVVELEHLKIETRLIDEKFVNTMG
jgi:hypothetical protein